MANLREHIRQSSGYKWWILGMIMLGTFMAVLDVTVVNVGLPAIMSAFGIGISSAEWVITAYMITMTIMLPSAGWFADRFGNKRVYMLGLALFTLGSWLCGKASSDPFLIGARALQGVGSGIIQALGLAIVTREFKPAERGLALGLWSMAAAASISFGPLLGGYLVDAYSWHKIFDVNVPVGVLAVLLAAFVQKEWKNQTRSPFDWQGFAAIVLFMPLAIYALARGNSPSNPGGWSAPEVIGCFIVAGAALAWFIVAELRNPAPLLQIRLLAERNFGISMAVLTLFAIGMLGGTYLLPLYMQRGLGYTALAAGSMFLPVGVIQGVLSAVSGYLTRYVRPLLLSAAVYAVLSAAHPIAAVDGAMLGELAQVFDLSLWTVLPALLILVLPLCRVPVRWSMAASVAAAFLVTVAQQRMPALQALRAALLGYAGPEGALREILSGGGVISMFTASVLAIATGLYAGLLSGIGALDGIREMVERAVRRAGLYPTCAGVCLLCAMMFCNQSTAPVVAPQLMAHSYEARGEGKRALALDIENSGIVLAALIPWNISVSIPLAMLGTGASALPYAVLLYMLPLCYLVTRRRLGPRAEKEKI